MTKSIYNLKVTDKGYGITKFSADLDPESYYIVSPEECECPQGHKPTCRHRRMLPMFLALARQDTEYFLDFDTLTWHKPLAVSYEIEYHNLEVRKREAALKRANEMMKEPAPQGVQVIPITGSTVLGKESLVTSGGELPPAARQKASTNAPHASSAGLAPPALHVPASAGGAPPSGQAGHSDAPRRPDPAPSLVLGGDGAPKRRRLA